MAQFNYVVTVESSKVRRELAGFNDEDEAILFALRMRYQFTESHHIYVRDSGAHPLEILDVQGIL